jgi:sarcosine oxidase subunit gamma
MGRNVTAEPLRPVDVAQVDVRTDPGHLPFDAPEANTTTTWNRRDVLWLGPDEWLVVGDAGEEDEILRAFGDALAGTHASMLDVSANRIVFDLADALGLLSTACGLDLDPTRWTPGVCAQTLLGQAQVILHQRDERTTRIFVRPSFAGYLVDRLRSAAPLS